MSFMQGVGERLGGDLGDVADSRSARADSAATPLCSSTETSSSARKTPVGLSRHVKIVESCACEQHSIAAEWDCLGFE